jgi:hypothetical protein
MMMGRLNLSHRNLVVAAKTSVPPYFSLILSRTFSIEAMSARLEKSSRCGCNIESRAGFNRSNPASMSYSFSRVRATP